MCHRCDSDRRPEGFGGDRKCAFDADGQFTSDNWNCATLGALMSLDRCQVIDGCDESMQIIQANPSDYGGWIVLTRYKHHGRTASAMWMGDGTPMLLTLAYAEKVLAGDWCL